MTKKDLEFFANNILNREKLSPCDNVLMDIDYYTKENKNNVKLGYNAGVYGLNYNVYFDYDLKKIIVSGYRCPATFLGQKI
jgi:hypothetical protein